jgi:hypothetical protein
LLGVKEKTGLKHTKWDQEKSKGKAQLKNTTTNTVETIARNSFSPPTAVYLGKGENMKINIYCKGTVSRDFLLLVFFVSHLPRSL